MVLSVIWNIPEPSKQKYKLKQKHVEEIKNAVQQEALLQELTFLKNEKAEELVELVNELEFEDALIVIKAIEVKYPNLIIGRGIEL